MAPNTDDKGAAELGREALAQFRDAARYGAKALAERKAARGASKDAGGAASELGELADGALARFGKKGKLASKVGVGHRLVDRFLPESEDEAGEEPDGAGSADGTDGTDAPEGGNAPEGEAPDADEHLFDARTPIPIQESIDVAVPVAAAFDLCLRFEELPRFSDRIDEVDVEDDTHLTVLAKVGTHRRTLGIEIVGEEPEERLDWDGIEGIEHTGVLTFHPLAPRLTRVEVTIEQRAERLRERLLRSVGLPERTVRQELRRFKAYAELWDEANDFKSADFKDPAASPPEAEEPEDEESPEDGAEPEEEADEEAEPAVQG